MGRDNAPVETAGACHEAQVPQRIPRRPCGAQGGNGGKGRGGRAGKAGGGGSRGEARSASTPHSCLASAPAGASTSASPHSAA